ncbi:MAG TPA: helix-turn-helix transcriptional regulator [Candidatus Nanoarchaeia archaeon]|nr:helix-turn-helix transcriptional regulator [Candidatus Nanoarchaeia archaeon]
MQHYEIVAQRFGRNIKYLRSMYGLTATQLSEKAGLKSRQHINNVESGKSTSLEAMVKLSNAFNIPLGYLLDKDIRRYALNRIGKAFEELKALTEEDLKRYEEKAEKIIGMLERG